MHGSIPNWMLFIMGHPIDLVIITLILLAIAIIFIIIRYLT